MKKINYVFILIASLYLCVLLAFMCRTDARDGASVGRITLASSMFSGDGSAKPEIWSPLYLYITARAVSLAGNIPAFFSGCGSPGDILILRLLTLFFCFLSIFPFYYLVKIIFNERAALISAFLMAVFPFNIRWSSIPLELNIFIFCMLSALALFFRYKKTGNIKDLAISSLMLFFACLFRVEGWLYIPILGAMLFARKGRDYRHIMVFAFIALAGPVIWMGIEYHFTGDCLYYLHKTSQIAARVFSLSQCSMEEKVWYWPVELYREISLPVFLLALLGVFYEIKKRKEFGLLSVAFIPVLVFMFASSVSSISLTRRYMLLNGILILPYAGMVIEKFRRFGKIIFSALLVLFLLLASVNSYLRLKADLPRFSSSERSLIDWCGRNIGPSEMLLVETEDWDFYAVMYYCGLKGTSIAWQSPAGTLLAVFSKKTPDQEKMMRFFIKDYSPRKELKYMESSSARLSRLEEHVDCGNLSSAVEKYRIRYFIAPSSGSFLKGLLKGCLPGCYNFNVELETEDYTIYGIRFPAPSGRREV
jgi:hypothetical protein